MNIMGTYSQSGCKNFGYVVIVSFAHIQCPPPPLDMSVTVKGHKFGNFNYNFYSFSMASKTLSIGLYKV